MARDNLDETVVNQILEDLRSENVTSSRPTLTWDPASEQVPFVELHFLEVAGIIDYFTDQGNTVAELTEAGRATLLASPSVF